MKLSIDVDLSGFQAWGNSESDELTVIVHDSDTTIRSARTVLDRTDAADLRDALTHWLGWEDGK